jgi:hypothetical protein
MAILFSHHWRLRTAFVFGLHLPMAAGAQWRFTAPESAGAWFAALDSVRLDGAGALSFHRSAGNSSLPLAAQLARDPRFEMLLFVPLYFPSATGDALVEAVRDASSASAPRAARAQFLVGALRQSLPTAPERAGLGRVAALAATARAVTVPAERLDHWQRQWENRFAPALAPYLARERLDGGIVMIADALGPEGRLFSGVPADRRDNVIAVGTPLAPGDEDGPLFAVVRELSFPLVSRAADRVPGFGRDARAAARRTSLAAVRCGAELLDLLLPAEAGAYRTHWRLAADAGGRQDFDTLFPPDSALAPRLRAAILQLAPSP